MRAADTQPIENAIVRIKSTEGAIFGAGFFVGERHVLSCAHVVSRALGGTTASQPSEDELVTLDFPLIDANHDFKARVVCWLPDEDKDIAGLELQDPPPPAAAPALLVTGADLMGHNCRSFGFPANYQVHGRGSSGILNQRNAFGWLQIDPTESPGQKHFITTGFSGAPVWDDDLQAVVGMVVASDQQLSMAAMIPVDQLLNAWPTLVELVRKQLRQNWFVHESRRRARLLQTELDGHDAPRAVNSPLAGLWFDFVSRRSWHEVLLDDLDRIQEAALVFPELRSLYTAIAYIDFDETYEVIVQGLRRLRFSNAVNSISRIIGQTVAMRESEYSSGYNHEKNDLENRLEQARDLRQNIIEFQEQLDAPRFARCFLVLGSSGSGKSFFLASTLAAHPEYDKRYLTLPLRLESRTLPLPEIVLRDICRFSGVQWSALEEFNAYLDALPDNDNQESPLRLVIALDDLQEWLLERPEFRQEFVSVVRQHTRLHSFYWLVTLQLNFLDQAMGERDDFWKIYSDVSDELRILRARKSRLATAGFDRPPHVGGWFMLDGLNKIRRVGIEILRQETAVDDLALDTLSDDDPTIRQVSQPFTAWVLIELQDTLPIAQLVDLNWIDFVNQFWIQRSNRLDPHPLDATTLTRAIGLIATALANSGELIPLVEPLLNEVADVDRGRSILRDTEVVRTAIDVLVRSNFVEIVEGEDELGLAVSRLHLHEEIFWQWHLATRLRRDETLFSQPPDQLQALWRNRLKSMGVPAIRDGAYIYLLLLLDQGQEKYQPVEPKVAQTLWLLGLEEETALMGPVWFAGSKAAGDVQQRLWQWANDHYGQAMKGNALLAFMHFISEAAPKMANRRDRLFLLQPLYESIYLADLVDYFVYIAGQFLDSLRDPSEVVACMDALSGCELIDAQEILAALSMEALIRVCNNQPEQIIPPIYEYLLQQEWSYVDKGYRVPGPWRREFYREWLLYEFCGYSVGKLGIVDAFDFFQNSGWYQPHQIGLGKQITLEMEREANIALGYYYRSQWDMDEEIAFGQQLETLIESGKTRDRILAFHIIRHTCPIDGRERIEVGEEFHDMLREIERDPRLAWLVKRFKGVFEASLR
jgi:hypothetical protein